MSETEYRTMYGVTETFEGLQVVEVEATPTEEGWTIRRKRGRSVWFDFAPKDKLYDSREKAEARIKEVLAGG